jgi:hypothetical protein
MQEERTEKKNCKKHMEKEKKYINPKWGLSSFLRTSGDSCPIPCDWLMFIMLIIV